MNSVTNLLSSAYNNMPAIPTSCKIAGLGVAALAVTPTILAFKYPITFTAIMLGSQLVVPALAIGIPAYLIGRHFV